MAAAILYLGYLPIGQALMLGWIPGYGHGQKIHFGDFTGADGTVSWLLVLACFGLIRLVRWRSVLAALITVRATSLLASPASVWLPPPR